MESGKDSPIPAAVDAVTEMTNRLAVDDRNAHLLKLDDEGGNVYSCKGCHTHLARADDIIPKDFRGENGRAYLFDKVVNVTDGVKEDRTMATGIYTVLGILCVGCGSIVGWKYEAAREKRQSYKEGKYILERYQLLGPKRTKY